MAPRSKPRASKKKVASRSAAEMVLREEILGRVFDYLEVEEITESAAVCKQFDAALPRVTCLMGVPGGGTLFYDLQEQCNVRIARAVAAAGADFALPTSRRV